MAEVIRRPRPRRVPATVRDPRSRLAVACLAFLLAVAAAAPHAAAELAIPAGFRVDERSSPVAGLEHLRLVRQVPPLVVHLARLHPNASLKLRTVLSNERVAGPGATMERTSEMCRRAGCVVAVNGDFGLVATGEPIGGVIAGGEMLRSPVDSHHQLSVAPDGSLAAGTLQWSGRLMPSDLRQLVVDGVNVRREPDRVVLYTPAFGPSTATNQFGAELVIRVVEPAAPVRLGQTALVELVELRRDGGDTAIPANGAVLSGHGAAATALGDLWERAQQGDAGRRALLRLEAAGEPRESIGGSPILVRDGRRWVDDDGSGFVGGRHPRTMVGWNAEGEVLLVTVDGRQPGYSVGMTLPEAAELMLALGATDAINLDGGGSTTFVVGGAVVNRPSDRLVRSGTRERIVHQPGPGEVVIGSVERPVSVALVLVLASAGDPPPVDPLAGPSAALPRELALAPARGDDPGSLPGASAPALVTALPPDPGPGPLVVGLAVLANLAVAVAVPVVARRSPTA
jgi:hypothetical protein